MSVFQVIPVTPIAEANLASSTVPELDTGSGQDPAEWNAATAYSLGQLVSRAGVHKVFRNILSGTNSDLPESAAAATRWEFASYTNRWRCLFQDRNKPTVATSPFVVELQPGRRVNSWFVGGVVADFLTVSMLVDDVVIYTVTVPMTLRLSRTWSDYFFGDFENKPADLRFNMPLSSAAVISFEFTRAAGTVQVKSIVVGRSVEIGRALANPKSDNLNFSRIERNFDGEFGGLASLTKRPLKLKTQHEVLAHVDLLPGIRKLQVDVNADVAVWSALGDNSSAKYFDSFLVRGIFREFVINAPHDKHALIQLELEEF